MNTNLKIFIAIFLFISGVVGAVLCVVNLMAEPVGTVRAAGFGVAGLIGVVCGSLLLRKPSY